MKQLQKLLIILFPNFIILKCMQKVVFAASKNIRKDDFKTQLSFCYRVPKVLEIVSAVRLL